MALSDIALTSRALIRIGAAPITSFDDGPDESEFPPYFDQALITRLAAEFTIPITENTSRAETMFKLSDMEFQRTRQIDAQQDTPGRIEDFSLVQARTS